MRTGVLRQLVQVRNGGGSAVQLPARWSESTRGRSNVTAMDDPPTAPLPEEHDLGDGDADFSNWIDKYNDTSLSFALMGAGIFIGSLVGLGYAAKRSKNPSPFTPREVPHLNEDLAGYVKDPHKYGA